MRVRRASAARGTRAESRAERVEPTASLANMQRVRAWAEIDLAAFGRNLERIQAAAGAGVEVMLVLKADAYGHGAAALARFARGRGVKTFCVGTVEEAVELRRAGISERVLLLGTLVDEESHDALAHGIELCVHSSDRCRMLDALAVRRGTRARVHLNVDTGMGRLGVHPERALELASEIRDMPGLDLVGLTTHVAACDGLADPRGRAQIERFDALCTGLLERGALPPLVHAANSAVLFTAPAARTAHAAPAQAATQAASRRAPLYSGVRPGISAYGLLPPQLPHANELEPILSLWTRVVFFKDVPRGTPIGYDGTYTTTRDSRIATLPIGYHDGMAWRCGNRAHVLVRGRRVPVVGRVSMDYTTIDVTDVAGVTVGDPVVVIGRQGDESIGALEFARNADTIPYEVTCTIGRRVPRVLVHERSADEIVPAVAGARAQR